MLRASAADPEGGDMYDPDGEREMHDAQTHTLIKKHSQRMKGMIAAIVVLALLLLFAVLAPHCPQLVTPPSSSGMEVHATVPHPDAPPPPFTDEPPASPFLSYFRTGEDTWQVCPLSTLLDSEKTADSAAIQEELQRLGQANCPRRYLPRLWHCRCAFRAWFDLCLPP
jgi:hypothetical protein